MSLWKECYGCSSPNWCREGKTCNTRKPELDIEEIWHRYRLGENLGYISRLDFEDLIRELAQRNAPR